MPVAKSPNQYTTKNPPKPGGKGGGSKKGGGGKKGGGSKKGGGKKR
jgi:hypothetical protein